MKLPGMTCGKPTPQTYFGKRPDVAHGGTARLDATLPAALELLLLLLLLLGLVGVLLMLPTAPPADPATAALKAEPLPAEATPGLDIALEGMLLGVKATQMLGGATAGVVAGGMAAGAAVCETVDGHRAADAARRQLTLLACRVGCSVEAAQGADCLLRVLRRASAMAFELGP